MRTCVIENWRWRSLILGETAAMTICRVRCVMRSGGRWYYRGWWYCTTIFSQQKTHRENWSSSSSPKSLRRSPVAIKHKQQQPSSPPRLPLTRALTQASTQILSRSILVLDYSAPAAMIRKFFLSHTFANRTTRRNRLGCEWWQVPAWM